jgi:hypothetical protein
MSRLNIGDSLILDSDYPNSETKTGATWHDGKPIYEYHIVAGSYSKTGGTNITITTDLTSRNVDTFIKTRGFLIRDIAGALTVYEIGLTFVATDGSYSPLAITPYYNYSTKVHTVQLSGNTNMTFTKGDYYVYYTKTTD